MIYAGLTWYATSIDRFDFMVEPVLLMRVEPSLVNNA